MSVNFGKNLIILVTLAVVFIHCNSAKKMMHSSVKQDTIAISNPPLQETHWNLAKLSGEKINDSAHKEIYIVLKKEQNRMQGNGGCNTITGTYTLSKKNQILFGQLISTRMMCPGIKYEDAFLKSLSSTDHYYLNADTLLFTHGKLLPVARFIAKE